MMVFNLFKSTGNPDPQKPFNYVVSVKFQNRFAKFLFKFIKKKIIPSVVP